MKSKVLDSNNGAKTWIVIFESGEEVTSGLLEFAAENRLNASSFTAVGAFEDVILGFFEWGAKEYRRIPIQEQVEVLALVGDVATENGEPKVHAHVVVGKSDGTAHGGHLLEAHVRPTLELVLTEAPKHLERKYDPETGLALIRPQGN